jgi:hypothetical protein
LTLSTSHQAAIPVAVVEAIPAPLEGHVVADAVPFVAPSRSEHARVSVPPPPPPRGRALRDDDTEDDDDTYNDDNNIIVNEEPQNHREDRAFEVWRARQGAEVSPHSCCLSSCNILLKLASQAEKLRQEQERRRSLQVRAATSPSRGDCSPHLFLRLANRDGCTICAAHGPAISSR